MKLQQAYSECGHQFLLVTSLPLEALFGLAQLIAGFSVHRIFSFVPDSVLLCRAVD